MSRIAIVALAASLCAFPAHTQQPASVPTLPPSPAQTTPPASTASPSHDNTDELLRELNEETSANNSEGPAGIVPYTNGFNGSLISTSQHDSSGGWSNILTPNVAWRFNRRFSTNIEFPLYNYIDVSAVTGQTKLAGVVISNTYTLETNHFLLGDTTIAFDFEVHPYCLDYNFTATMGAPTGDFPNGLGAGQYTYNINNHLEHTYFGFLSPEIELGIGDSSSLIASSIRKSYVAVGEQAHFQAGLSFALRWFDAEFSSDAYENMPLSTQTITTITNQGKKGAIKLVKSSRQESVGEDNGFANTLDFPLASHYMLSGFYNRSLLNHEDTVGFSIAFLLRGNGARSTK